MKMSLYYPHSMLHNCSSFKILSRFTEFWGDLFPQKYTEKELVEKIETLRYTVSVYPYPFP